MPLFFQIQMKHCEKEFQHVNPKILKYKYVQSMYVKHENNIIIEIMSLEHVNLIYDLSASK